MERNAKSGERSSPRFIGVADLDNLRCGRDGGSQHRLRDACGRYLKMFTKGFSKQDIEDIVSGAVADATPTIQSTRASVDETNEVIKRALERRRKQAQRERERYLDRDPEDNLVLSSRTGGDPIDQIVARDSLCRLLETAEPLMKLCLEGLSDRDHDILIYFYQYDEFDFKPRCKRPVFVSDDARKKALQRARRRFNEALERELLDRLKIANSNKEILEDVLEIVRGGTVREVLGVREVV